MSGRLSAFNSPFLLGFDQIEQTLDRLTKSAGDSYPPYNIERTGENDYQITMAVAGFGENELSIEAHANVLTVRGEKAEEEADDGREYLYRGIAKRAFERRFQLADHMEVRGASLKNGILHVALLRKLGHLALALRVELLLRLAQRDQRALPLADRRLGHGARRHGRGDDAVRRRRGAERVAGRSDGRLPENRWTSAKNRTDLLALHVGAVDFQHQVVLV